MASGSFFMPASVLYCPQDRPGSEEGSGHDGDKADHRRYLLATKRYVSFEDIPRIKYYITTKSWWDTIDFLCKVIGDIGSRDPRVKDLMIDWSKNENVWLKRTAIEHQLGLKDRTDAELLEQIIANNFGSSEFFVNKAIGWALRDYSKTDPAFVKGFIKKHKDEMDALSIKEASKYI